MDDNEIVAALVKEYGYKVRGWIPSGWVLVRPDGTLMRACEAMAELERLTAPKS